MPPATAQDRPPRQGGKAATPQPKSAFGRTISPATKRQPTPRARTPGYAANTTSSASKERELSAGRQRPASAPHKRPGDQKAPSEHADSPTHDKMRTMSKLPSNVNVPPQVYNKLSPPRQTPPQNFPVPAGSQTPGGSSAMSVSVTLPHAELYNTPNVPAPAALEADDEDIVRVFQQSMEAIMLSRLKLEEVVKIQQKSEEALVSGLKQVLGQRRLEREEHRQQLHRYEKQIKALQNQVDDERKKVNDSTIRLSSFQARVREMEKRREKERVRARKMEKDAEDRRRKEEMERLERERKEELRSQQLRNRMKRPVGSEGSYSGRGVSPGPDRSAATPEPSNRTASAPRSAGSTQGKEPQHARRLRMLETLEKLIATQMDEGDSGAPSNKADLERKLAEMKGRLKVDMSAQGAPVGSASERSGQKDQALSPLSAALQKEQMDLMDRLAEERETERRKAELSRRDEEERDKAKQLSKKKITAIVENDTATTITQGTSETSDNEIIYAGGSRNMQQSGGGDKDPRLGMMEQLVQRKKEEERARQAQEQAEAQERERREAEAQAEAARKIEQERREAEHQREEQRRRDEEQRERERLEREAREREQEERDRLEKEERENARREAEARAREEDRQRAVQAAEAEKAEKEQREREAALAARDRAPEKSIAVSEEVIAGSLDMGGSTGDAGVIPDRSASAPPTKTKKGAIDFDNWASNLGDDFDDGDDDVFDTSDWGPTVPKAKTPPPTQNKSDAPILAVGSAVEAALAASGGTKKAEPKIDKKNKDVWDLDMSDDDFGDVDGLDWTTPETKKKNASKAAEDAKASERKGSLDWGKMEFDSGTGWTPTAEQAPPAPAAREGLPYDQGEDASCICGAGYDGRSMLDCDNCNKWMHCDCVGVDVNKIPAVWYCPTCRPKMKKPPTKPSAPLSRTSSSGSAKDNAPAGGYFGKMRNK